MPGTLRVLVVDDDPKFRQFACAGLAESGLRARAADGVAAARTELEDGEFDAILLDVMMPDEDGTVLLHELRARGDTVPVLFVTARGETDERVAGLRAGADDYVVKPFTFAELVARIEAVVRRHRGTTRFETGAFVLDHHARSVRHGDRATHLSGTEFGLLCSLLRRHGEPVDRGTLLREVWQTTQDPGTNVVDVLVGRLRKKLAAIGAPGIETVRGVGYRIEEDD